MIDATEEKPGDDATGISEMGEGKRGWTNQLRYCVE